MRAMQAFALGLAVLYASLAVPSTAYTVTSGTALGILAPISGESFLLPPGDYYQQAPLWAHRVTFTLDRPGTLSLTLAFGRIYRTAYGGETCDETGDNCTPYVGPLELNAGAFITGVVFGPVGGPLVARPHDDGDELFSPCFCSTPYQDDYEESYLSFLTFPGLGAGDYVLDLVGSGQADPFPGPDADRASYQLAFDAVPEPSDWTMLVAGFGLSGAVLRRRRQGVEGIA